jgi:DNA-cytosine methyltransferase
VGDLFSGAGGLSLGFLLSQHPQVRFQPLFAIDSDPHALNAYRNNMEWLTRNATSVLPTNPVAIEHDLKTLDVNAIMRRFNLNPGDLDLLLGGPPCQGFSSSNRGSNENHKAEQNSLVSIFFEKLAIFRPKMFLFENVQGVRWTKIPDSIYPIHTQASLFPSDISHSITVRDFLIEKAQSLGYIVWHDILNALDFGVPQHRMRFFLFGMHKDYAGEPPEADLTSYLETLKSDRKISVGEAIHDLPALSNGERWKGDDYHPGTDEYIQKMRCFMVNGDLFDHFTTAHADYVIERYRKIPEGGNWQNIKSEMANYAHVKNTHSNIYRRLTSNLPAHTISHYRKSMVIHPKQDRGISFREACRLQSFPDWFRFEGPVDQQQQQLANAVPPLMASRVAWAIAERWKHSSKSASP